MRAEDLVHKELLEFDQEGGTIRFAGQRAVLLDTVAMGLLRKYLVENFGVTAARTVLTQFGFAHGWRMAEAMRSTFEWDSDTEWKNAGTRLNGLGGLFRVEPGTGDMLCEDGVALSASYEAEQHLVHFGRADFCVCWTICGLHSGYLSRAADHEVYVFEDRCVGRGDATCHLVARPREQWGKTHADDLRFFEPKHLKESLDSSLQKLTETLKLAEQRLVRRRRALGKAAPDVPELDGIVMKSPAMRQLVDLARRVAKVDATVLITGESGAGKERIARLLHEHSGRLAGPFIAVNCGAISETLLESELFGHARGAFTGASHDRAGLFEEAHTGTLLLDEIGEVSPAMQVKLLRVLQEREVRRVGENKSRRVDVRVVAATNRDLQAAIEGGTFRQDLYYRLKVVELHVPPLRERPEDILPLARVLLAESSLRMNRPLADFAPAAAEALLRYGWPGNVRELENAMERAVALAAGTRLEPEDLPVEVVTGVAPSAVQTSPAGTVRPLCEVEKEYILAALEQCGGNQTHTALALRIGSSTLYRKLKAYGVHALERPAGHTAPMG